MILMWGVGGALVELTPFVRSRHAGTLDKSFTYSCLREIPAQYLCCVGSASE